jgi:hypothetical protein
MTKPKISWTRRISNLQGILTSAAILAAGIWFLIQGVSKPLVHLDQHVTQRPYEGKPGSTMLSIDITATNFGKTPVNLKRGTRTLTVLLMNPPVDPKQATLQTYSLKGLILAPGETDQAAFIVIEAPPGYKTLVLHSEYSVPVTFLGIELPWSEPEVWQSTKPIDIDPTDHDKASGTTGPAS